MSFSNLLYHRLKMGGLSSSCKTCYENYFEINDQIRNFNQNPIRKPILNYWFRDFLLVFINNILTHIYTNTFS